MSHDASGDWIAEAITAGLEILDVDESLQQIANHVTTKGEWEKGVISPSLVGTVCRLQRLKKFLGHAPRPGRPVHMASAGGLPSAVSLINMDRGFVGEGLLVSALKTSLGDRVLAHAPTYAPAYVDPETGVRYTGHPDVLLLGEQGQPELVQIKCPSVFKFERVAGSYGDEDALETYRAQMATELFIARRDSVPNVNKSNLPEWAKALPLPVRNNLVLFTWEHTAKHTRARLHVVPMDWGPDLDTIPLAAGDEVYEDVAAALAMNVWPEAYPEHQYGVWPCAYCAYSRLGDYTNPDDVLPKCDDHESWNGDARSG